MRRRGKRGANNSEATGKIGQEIPQDQPAAIQPNYPDAPVRPAAVEADAEDFSSDLQAAAESAGGTETPAEEDTAPGKIVVETQPETVGAPVEPTAVAAGDKATLRGYVVLAIGLPGSGKTTWYKRRGVTPLSSDLLRTILFDDITDQRYSGLVFSTLRSLLRARLIAKMPWNYVDATNLSAHERRQWIKMAKSFGYEAQAVYFDVPLAVCVERNSKRERRVADDVMQKMAERLRPPSFKEGFSKITVVRVKGQPGSPAPSAEATAEAFNAPVPADDEDAGSSMDTDSSGDFASPDIYANNEAVDAGEAGENAEPASSDEPSGRLEVLDSGETSVR
ncbi:MAG: AAA family ATPase [Janthinobacterium lividum]